MLRTRLACATFAGWLFLLFNVERFHEPLNVASFVYVIAAVTAVAILAVKSLASIPYQWLLIGPLLVYFTFKWVWNYPLLGLALPMTVFEICAIATTVALAHHIASRLYRVEQASAAIVADDSDGHAESLETAQGAMYREVRRARQHARPLAVLAVSSSGENLKPTEEQLLREMQRELLQKYTNARIAGLLSKEARDHGIVSQCNRHFVVLLPETDRDSAEQIARQLSANVRSELGIQLQVGMSSFPDEEVTLVGLLQRAESEMRTGDLRRRSVAATAGKAAAAPPAKTTSVRETAVDEPALRDTMADAPPVTRVLAEHGDEVLETSSVSARSPK